jgi:hypothetical protein
MNPLSNSKKTLEYGSIDNAEEFIPLLSPIENNKDVPHTLEIQDNILTIKAMDFQQCLNDNQH